MQAGRLFRQAAIAWLLTAIARILVAVLGTGLTGLESSPVALAIGATVGIVVAGLLWVRPGRGSAIVATLLGLYAALGLAYAPIVGPQPWFIVLTGTDLIALVLSAACWRASGTDGDRGR